IAKVTRDSDRKGVTNSNALRSFPTLNRGWPDQRAPVTHFKVAHVQRIAVRQIFRDVPVVSQRDIWTLSGQAHAIPVIFKFVSEQPYPSFSAPTNDCEQHWIPPHLVSTSARPYYESPSNPAQVSELWNREDS